MNWERVRHQMTWGGAGRARRRHSGVTLIELMVTVAVLAVVTAIAYPSFTGVLRSNRVATATNELIASLSLARSEAIRSAHPAGVCPSVDGSKCEESGDWSEGFLVAGDKNAASTGSFDPRVPILRFVAFKGEFAVAGAKELRFDGRGRNSSGATTLALQPADCAKGEPYRREIHISPTGQLRTAKGDCQ